MFHFIMLEFFDDAPTGALVHIFGKIKSFFLDGKDKIYKKLTIVKKYTPCNALKSTIEMCSAKNEGLLPSKCN